jgi:hypothetical protein
MTYITNYNKLLSIICILNEFKDHWLLIDALNATISMSLKLTQEILLWDDFINDDDSNFSIELG